MKIDDETTDVLIGGYLSAEAAHADYESVLGCGERLWGAVGGKALHKKIGSSVEKMAEEGADGKG